MTVTLQQIVDRTEIIDVCTRLHLLIDRRAYGQLSDVLAETVSWPSIAEASAPGFSPAQNRKPRQSVIDAYPVTLAGRKTQHLVTGHQVTIEGDGASCSANALAVLVPEGGPPGSVTLLGIVYHYLLERTSAGWRIWDRQSDVLWQQSAA